MDYETGNRLDRIEHKLDTLITILTTPTNQEEPEYLEETENENRVQNAIRKKPRTE